MARTRATIFALLFILSAIAACNNEQAEAPAPDVSAKTESETVASSSRSEEETAPAKGGRSEKPVEAAPTSASAPGYEPGSREPDYKHLSQIRRAREHSYGKLARMYLKLNRHHDWLENTVVMLATDGSYSSAMLHYDEGFKPAVLGMKRGFVYEVEFEVTKVSSGGQPRGEILSIDRRSSGPVADQTKFLPAVEAVHAAKELPEEIKEARRKKIHNSLENIVETVEEGTEEE